MNTKLSKLVVAIGALVLGNAAVAAPAVGTLDVSASIAANCVFAAANATLPFGALTVTDLLLGKNEVTPATVNITCTNSGVPAVLYGGATRNMASGVNVVAYEVYTDAGRITALSSTLAGGVSVPADGTAKSITLYGKTATGQGVKPVGTYTQALALTVEF